ncbi:plasmid pRiA4b ORF-3 family protein [bacterium]|nr:plasmid pRiA4b ORF-3 family protein [candidate division CSSED10-310 bacterium]
MYGNKNLVYRFRITLEETNVWRLIDVPSTYSFWDLHVAIQDAMGWLDYHLHLFKFRPKHKQKDIEIGIPDPDFGDIEASWEIPIASYLYDPGIKMEYLYDFGDDWVHSVFFEGIMARIKGIKYPVCLDGAGACPPEDVGGVYGYENMLKILADPSHEEYQSYETWLSGHARNYWPYDPAHFDPEAVKFDNPQRRYKLAFS